MYENPVKNKAGMSLLCSTVTLHYCFEFQLRRAGLLESYFRKAVHKADF